MEAQIEDALGVQLTFVASKVDPDKVGIVSDEPTDEPTDEPKDNPDEEP